jgi:maltose alpha-D-glucosyltransferase/alpha-amylase
MVECPNSHVLAFIRRWGEQHVLVVANLSRFVQHAELALHEFSGNVPLEVFGRTRFPAIDDAPYPLTLGPHAFLWFELTDSERQSRDAALPRIEVERSWEEVFSVRGRGDLQDLLPSYIERCPAWELGGRSVLSVRLQSTLPLGDERARRWICVLRVTFTTGEPEHYLLPLGCRAVVARKRPGPDVVARLFVRSAPRARYELFDAAEDSAMAGALVGELQGEAPSSDASGLEVVLGEAAAALPDGNHVPRSLQRGRPGSNAVFTVDDGTVLKLFRRLEAGPNPEIEMRSRLRRVGFAHTPALIAAFRGNLEAARPGNRVWFGILQANVQNDGEAWAHAVKAARTFFRLARRRLDSPPSLDRIVPMAPWDGLADPAVNDLIAPYTPIAERLGKKTADLHKALAAVTDDLAFAIEPPTALSRRSAYQRMRTLAVSVLETLGTRLPEFDPVTREIAASALGRRADVLDLFHRLLERPFTSPRIRCHGNLHLGQILHAGDELVIIDFDGEPGRPLYERRLKRSALQDVASMVRSFHYAAHAALRERQGGSRDPGEEATSLQWMRAWQLRVSAVFIDAYSREVAASGLLPSDPDEARVLFQTYLVERALYEVGFELNHRPEWLAAPLLDLPLLLASPHPDDAAADSTINSERVAN